MAHAEEEDDEREEEPSRVRDPKREEQKHRAPGEVAGALAEDRAGDMAAIELSRGEQVDRGHEEPYPARERGGMSAEGVEEGLRKEALEEPVKERTHRHFPAPANHRRPCVRGAEKQPDDRDRDSDREPNEGPGDSDFEERLPVRDRIPHRDERAKGPEDRDGRDEEREGGADPVPLCHHVVPHLVGSQDREEGDREAQEAEHERLEGGE
jgi:hypothetical protein